MRPQIPERFKNTKWNDVPKSLKSIVELIPKTRKGIYLHGGVGSGKTHIVYAIAEYVYTKLRFESRVINSADMLNDIRDCFENRFQGDFIDELKGYRGMLIIDDIGVERINDWVLEQFYVIINKRYNDVLPTIFTSNLSVSQLSDRIGERVASRIVEMCDVYELTNTDRRLG